MAADPSSLSYSANWKYDVFLSFRGSDTRQGFVDLLCEILKVNGSRTFEDDELLESGRSIAPSCIEAIEKSRIAIVVHPENDASWCLEELVMIVVEYVEKHSGIGYWASPDSPNYSVGDEGDYVENGDKIVVEDLGEVSPLNFIEPVANDESGYQIGDIIVRNEQSAIQSSNVLVLEGSHNNQRVAARRYLQENVVSAIEDIEKTIASGSHQYVPRSFSVAHEGWFLHTTIQVCPCSLDEMIQIYAPPSLKARFNNGQVVNMPIEYKNQEDPIKGPLGDLNLWKPNNKPSVELLEVMRSVASEMEYMHGKGLVHGDLNPQGILVTKESCLCVKFSNMGINKCFSKDKSSLVHNVTGSNSSGWKAPEELLGESQTQETDMFSLGYLFFYCITGGNHPFDKQSEHDNTNENDQVINLSSIDDIPEAKDLISRLLNRDPKLRPKGWEVPLHPIFWNSEKKLLFLCDANSKLTEEKTSQSKSTEEETSGSKLTEEKTSQSNNLSDALEGTAPIVLRGSKWNEKIDPDFIDDIERARKSSKKRKNTKDYDHGSVKDLVRVIRNKYVHYRELEEKIKKLLGKVPDDYYEYFASRFPDLLIEVYKVFSTNCEEGDYMKKYFP